MGNTKIGTALSCDGLKRGEPSKQAEKFGEGRAAKIVDHGPQSLTSTLTNHDDEETTAADGSAAS